MGGGIKTIPLFGYIFSYRTDMTDLQPRLDFVAGMPFIFLKQKLSQNQDVNIPGEGTSASPISDF